MMVLNLRADRDVKEPDICPGEKDTEPLMGSIFMLNPPELTECRAEETRVKKSRKEILAFVESLR